MSTTYPVICADPPWLGTNQGNRASPKYQGHYQPMPASQIMALGPFVQGIAPRDAALFLWAPAIIVLDGTATAACRAWGFEPKQKIPWVKTTAAGKPAIGLGNYTRVCHEDLILAIRGRGPRVLDRGVPGVIMAPRGRHSAKPDASYELIERLFDGPYAELFARRRWSEKWWAWGDEMPLSDQHRSIGA